MTVQDPEVRTWVSGHLGRIELNRPASLNAVNHEMLRTIHQTLNKWAHDPAVHAVAITGAGQRAFCAGGDIISVYRDAISPVPSRDTQSAAVFQDEYALDLAIHRYPKPYVAIMSGLVLGGGVGLSAHGSYRVVTESSSVGMPEASIGFVPDAGGTWLLSRTPGELGTYLALTADSVGAGDAIAVGLADHFVPQASVNELLEALATGSVQESLEDFVSGPPPGQLLTDREWIDLCFRHDSASSIVRDLKTTTNPSAYAAAAKIEANSPTAVAVTLEALRRVRDLASLAEALDLEHRLACNLLQTHDVAEGIRAALIDKDRQPRWRPSKLSEVSRAAVDRLFDADSDKIAPTPISGITT